MSLLLHEDHRAWQQRINKEIFTASRANEFFSHNSTANSFKPRSSSQLKRSQQKTQKLSQRSKKTQLTASDKDKMLFNMSFGMYAEVRGKYARPAPKLNKGFVNPLLKRPHTAFSLRPKSANGKRNEKKEKFDPFLEYLEQSFRAEERPATSSSCSNKESQIEKRRASEENNFERRTEGKIGNIEDKIGNLEEKKGKDKGRIERVDERKEDIDKKIGSVEGKLGKIEENKEDVQTSNGHVEKSINENPEVMNSPKTQEKNENEVKNRSYDVNVGNKKLKNFGIKSSSSVSSAKKRYIEELERTLREEKLKRMKLEEILNNLN